jgi:hypothetical protein
MWVLGSEAKSRQLIEKKRRCVKLDLFFVPATPAISR